MSYEAFNPQIQDVFLMMNTQNKTLNPQSFQPHFKAFNTKPSSHVIKNKNIAKDIKSHVLNKKMHVFFISLFDIIDLVSSLLH